MTVEAPALDETFAAPAGEAQLGRAADALRERGYNVHLVDTAADARRLIADLLPKNKGVFASVSETAAVRDRRRHRRVRRVPVRAPRSGLTGRRLRREDQARGRA